jgi:hypothetical protein
MRRLLALLLIPVLMGLVAFAQAPNTAEKDSPAGGSPKPASPAVLEREFFAVIREGDALKFLAYVPEDGVHLGRYADHTSRSEIEDELTHRTGLYCKLFDSACIPADKKADSGGRPCSYRELLTQSDKVRTASTETTRNNVRQAILVAEVHNQKCAGPGLIDFIFNYQQGGWKLFSIP